MAPDQEGSMNLVEQAEAYADAGQYPEAIASYQEAIVQNPRSAVLHHDLALVYEEAGDLDRAESLYKQALALQPDLTIAYYNLGLLYKQKGLPELAYRCLARCLDQTTDPEIRMDATAEIETLKIDSSGIAKDRVEEDENASPETETLDQLMDLEDIERLAIVVRSHRRMQANLRLLGLITLILGIFGLIEVLYYSISSISLIVIGLIVLLIPLRTMFLALTVCYGWLTIEMLALQDYGQLFNAASCALPIFAAATLFVAVLFFRYKAIENQYQKAMVEGKIDTKSIRNKYAHFLSWIGYAGGSLSIVSFIISIFIGMGLAVQMIQSQEFDQVLDKTYLFILSLSYSLAIIGVAISGASIAENRQDKAIAVIGITCSGIVLSFWLGVFIFLAFIGEQIPAGSILSY